MTLEHLKWVSDIRRKELEFEGKHIRNSIQWPQRKNQESFFLSEWLLDQYPTNQLKEVLN